SLFIIGHMGLFFYTQKGSIISTVVLPTTEIIEPISLRALKL
ncbi:AraC family transcriptional regulator, partial [Streptococcus suis]|nr:AraC family transcriptional regulator [Streptococcus suis]MBS8108442.1 AraC family transcriptional regulator [Streptococcus suis]MBS8117351.1 AraC family transcriptional regulator [Streptococcus suis]